MLYSPQSNILLFNNVSFSAEYTHVLDFASKDAQQTYFNSRVKHNLADYKFVRKDTRINIHINIEDLYDCNYLAYKNKDKWIYCFILSKEYVNDNNTSLIIKTDVWQTYMFDHQLKECFVLREHTTPTNFSLLDEGFDLGSEYVQYAKQNVFQKEDAWLMIIGAVKQRKVVKNGKVDNADKPIEVLDICTAMDIVPAVVHGVPYQVMLSPISTRYLQNELMKLSGSSALMGVVKCSKYPTFSLKEVTIPYITKSLEESSTVLEVINTGFAPLSEVIDEVGSDVKEIYPNDLIGSTLENGVELFDPRSDARFNYYPYSYSILTDYISNPLLVKHEYLNGLSFKSAFCYSTEPSERYWIEGYCGDTGGNVHNITNNNVISIPLANDTGALFYAQNKNQIDNNLRQNKNNTIMGVLGGASALVGGAIASATGVGATVGGAAMVGGASKIATSVIHGEQNIRSEMARTQDIINQPMSMQTMGKPGNQNAFGINKVDYISFTIHDDVKSRIGSYWHQYGYKCMEVKVPNTKSRSNFNYVQTANSNISGNLDSNDMIELKNIYNKGVTIWHDPSMFMEYKYINKEV